MDGSSEPVRVEAVVSPHLPAVEPRALRCCPALSNAGWNVERAAELSGLSDTHVRALLKKYKLTSPRPRSIPPSAVGPGSGFPRRPTREPRDKPMKVHDPEIAALVEDMLRAEK